MAKKEPNPNNPQDQVDQPAAPHPAQSVDEAMSSVIEDGRKPGRLSSAMAADFESCIDVLEASKRYKAAPLHDNLRILIGQLDEYKDQVCALEKQRDDLRRQVAELHEENEGLRVRKQVRGSPRSNRPEFVNTGAILLPDGTRMALRYIASYRAGGTEEILFHGTDGKIIGQLRPPKSMEGAQDGAKRKAFRDHALETLDEIFEVARE
jgi:hypothetical protein